LFIFPIHEWQSSFPLFCLSPFLGTIAARGRSLTERDVREEEEKQNKLREEEVRVMKTWSEEKSWWYVERFRGYRGDMSITNGYLLCL